MRIHFPLSMLSFLLILFFILCSRGMKEISEEMKLSITHCLTTLSLNKPLKNSLKIVLEYAINISEADLSNIANDPSWFHYEYDDNQNVAVKVKLTRPYTIIIHKPSIRQYD